MFREKIILSFEGTPLEVLRRYAPQIIGAMTAVGVVAAIYYIGFNASDDMFEGAGDAAADTINDCGDIADGVFERIVP